MSKLSIAEAVKIIPVSESTLRRNLKTGKVSYTTDTHGNKQVDVSELERVYGKLTITDNQNDRHDNQNDGTDNHKIISLLEEQITDLKSQLVKAEKREQDLMDMLKTEQEKTKLMLPVPKQRTGFWQRIAGLTNR